MSGENYSIVTDVNAGNSAAVINQLVESIMRVEAAITKVSAKSISPKVENPNLSNFFAACDKAEAKTIKVKSQIEAPQTVGSGLSSFLNAEKGKFGNVGKELGQSLQMGMQQQFGMAGGVASSLGGALGTVGIAGMAAVAGVVAVGAAATQAAMKWEDLKTSIGRTTGLKGGDLEDLMSQLQDLRQEFGITAEAASSMVEQAGSIGVGQSKLNVGDMAGYKQEILDFTKSTAILQGAWGMSAEATSSGIGKMGSVTLGAWNIQRKALGEQEMSWADYAYKVGGTVDNLANAMGSSEEEIVTAMRNSSGAVAKWAPSEDTYGKWQAMASFLIDTGDSAGEAGTKIERVSQKMEQNGADVAKLMGMDQATLTSSLKTDFMGTVQDLGQTIATMPESSRPDLFKMFGLEGASMISKVVADIEAGTGKLQGAFDLALKPGNVAKGYEDVADNASKAFDRIGQAAQVSLEKIGGQLLPAVSEFANAIADAWIAANERGTELFATAQENAAKSRIEVNSVGDLAKAAGIFLGITDPDATEVSAAEMGTQTASVYTDYANAGIQAGNFDPITGKMKEVGAEAGKEAGEATAEEFAKAQDEYSKSHSSGGYSKSLLEGGTVTTSRGETINVGYMGSQYAGDTGKFGYNETELDRTNLALLENYVLQTYARKSDKGGVLQVTDSSGGIIKSESYASDKELADLSDRLTDAIEPSFTDMPEYMKGVSGEMSSTLEGILSDGVVEFTEKNQLEEYIKSLDALRIESPVEFDAIGLDKIRDDLVKTAAGIPLTLDTGEVEANFALWLTENKDYFEKIFSTTGQIPMEEEQRQRQKWELGASEDQMKWWNLMKDAFTSGDPGAISAAWDYKVALEAISPELKDQKWYYQALQTGQKEFQNSVKVTGSTFQIIDTDGKTLGGTFLITANAANVLSPAFIEVSNSAISAANALSTIQAGMLSAGVGQWAQSRISDSLINNAYSGSYSGSLSGTTGFNTASVATVNDFGGLLADKGFFPKLALGGKVTSGGLAWIGEAGTEYVIPESEIKGLYPESAKVDMGSINYKPFLDYPEPEIRAPTSYRWSQYPEAPQVQEFNTDAIQTAWLADNQLNTRDIYSGLIRDAQLAAIGKSQVQPWFARGEMEQPKWWSEAATKLSPQYKENWEANTGGTVPSIEKDTANSSMIGSIATQTGKTVSDAWSQLYGESFTEGCIATNAPDAALKFTPSASLVSEMGRAWGSDATVAWNQLYGEAFTEGCIGANKPDSLLKFTPSANMLAETARAQGGSWGSQIVGSGGGSDKAVKLLGDIEKNTAASDNKLAQSVDILAKGIFETQGSLTNFPQFSVGGNGALVTGISKEGYIATYDPRTDTCEGLSFVAPNPSLKTNDPFYLGLTENSPAWVNDDPGYGWSGEVAQTSDSNLANLQKMAEKSYQESQKNAKTDEKTEKNTAAISKDMNALTNGGTTGIGELVTGMISGDWFSGAASQYGSILMPNRVGTGYASAGAATSTSSGGSWGAGASGAASASPGGGSWGGGSFSWGAKGGMFDPSHLGLIGEAGLEAGVPISDRSAGLRILPHVMSALGVRMMARGGIVGSGSAAAAINPSVTIGDIKIYAPPGMDTTQLARKVAKEIKKEQLAAAKKVRSG